MRRHHSEQETTGIDLAPMLDFVLNLLIFFIITAVFAREVALTVNRAGAAPTGAAKEAKSVLIAIRANGEIWVEDRVVDVRAVRANIERVAAVKPDSGVLIVADANSEAGVLVAVVDQVRQGGIENISFAGTR